MLTWLTGRSRISLSKMGLAEDQFVLVTIHRDMNTDDLGRLTAIFNTLIDLADKQPDGNGYAPPSQNHYSPA